MLKKDHKHNCITNVTRKRNQYQWTNSVALFIAKDELQLQTQMATPKGKVVFQNTFLQYQLYLNTCHLFITVRQTYSVSDFRMANSNRMCIEKQPVRDISFPSASWILKIKSSRRLVKGLNNTTEQTHYNLEIVMTTHHIN